MTQGMMDCAFGGAWLMGAIALLILLLLVVTVGALLVTRDRVRGDRP